MIFKAHSTRSALSSKARLLGISTKKILKSGHLSKESTSQKFYFRNTEKYCGQVQQSHLAWIFEERCFEVWLSSLYGNRRISKIRSGEKFVKWNLELHKGCEAPCRAILILWIKLKQQSNTRPPLPCFIHSIRLFFLCDEVTVDFQEDMTRVFVIAYFIISHFMVTNIFFFLLCLILLCFNPISFGGEQNTLPFGVF